MIWKHDVTWSENMIMWFACEQRISKYRLFFQRSLFSVPNCSDLLWPFFLHHVLKNRTTSKSAGSFNTPVILIVIWAKNLQNPCDVAVCVPDSKIGRIGFGGSMFGFHSGITLLEQGSANKGIMSPIFVNTLKSQKLHLHQRTPKIVQFY